LHSTTDRKTGGWPEKKEMPAHKKEKTREVTGRQDHFVGTLEEEEKSRTTEEKENPQGSTKKRETAGRGAKC